MEGSALGGHSNFFLLVLVPVALIIGVLWMCKQFDFSLIPEGMRGRKPSKFKFPKITRKQKNRMYKWDIEEDD